MEFLVLMNRGHFWMAYWKQLCAKSEVDSLVVYMNVPTPLAKLYTSTP